LAHHGWGIFEGREFVHAIIDNGQRLEVACETKGHGAIVPADIPLNPIVNEEVVEQFPLKRIAFLPSATERKRGDDSPQSGAAPGDSEASFLPFKNRLFNEEDPTLLGAATEEMLGTLIDEIPTQMRKTDQIVRKSHSFSFG
jgi:hypothetical protein